MLCNCLELFSKNYKNFQNLDYDSSFTKQEPAGEVNYDRGVNAD